MTYRELEFPFTIIEGTDALSRLGPLVAGMGDRAFVLADPVVVEHDLHIPVVQLLKASRVEAVLFHEISHTTSLHDLVRIGRILSASRAQVVVVLGGPTALRTARLLSATRGDLDLLQTLPRSVPPHPLPLVALPTTPRIPHLFAPRVLLVQDPPDPHLLVPLPHVPSLLLADPALTRTLPPRATASTLLALLADAAETLLASPPGLAAACASHTLGLLSRIAEPAVLRPDPSPLRPTLLQAGLLSALARRFTPDGPLTLLSLALSCRGLPGSWTTALLFVHAAPRLAELAPEVLKEVAASLGITGVAAEVAAAETASFVRRLLARAGLPTRLTDLELPRAALPEIARTAWDLDHPLRQLAAFPSSPDQAFLLGLLEAAC